MTRQIALGAVIAFAVTVLVLSVWEPKPPVAAPPPPPPSQVITTPEFRQNLRPALLRPSAIGRIVKSAPPVIIDAGAPLP